MGGATVPTQLVEVANVSTSAPTKLDLLFQIDVSPNTLAAQFQLRQRVDTLLASLGDVDLHVGVISSDLGASSTEAGTAPSDGPAECAGRGDDGQLERGRSTISDAYLVRGEDGTTNFTGTLAAEVDAMINLGANGCGFEQPLGAIRRALAPGANPGFRRADAALAIVILALEDDCSVLDSSLVTRADDAELGIRQSFRCTRFGVTCDEPMNEPGPKTNCRSNEGSPWLEPVDLTARALAAASPDVLVASITGPPAPVEVELRPPPMQTVAAPALAHACQYELATAEDPSNPTGTRVADPAVRISELVDRFASNGVRTALCAADLLPNLRAIGTGIKRLLGTTCLSDGNLADARSGDGLQPSCEVILTTADGIRSNLPSCADGASPCFTIAPDIAACGETTDHLRLTVTGAAPGGRIVARCEALGPG